MTEYFYKNKEGKVEFTEDALKALLDRVYNQGYNDGKNTGSIIWNSPSKWYDDWWNKPVITWCSSTNGTSATASSSNITLDSCTVASSSDLCTPTTNVTLSGNDISDLHVK